MRRLVVCCVAAASLLTLCVAGLAGASEKEYEDFDYDNFDNPTMINNPFMPFTPGTRWVEEGTVIEDGETLPHRIEFTVTDLTKEIDGVQTVVCWIVDVSDGEVVEKEVAFYAQDNDGNVWFLGEHPQAYEDGEMIEAPTWIPGVAGARAGLAMPAEPKAGTPSFSEGWGPAVDWTDRAQVFAVGKKVCVPLDCYEDVLILDEYDAKEPGFKQKYYARGVGQIRTGWRGDVESQEELELVELTHLDADGLAKIRAEALALEKEAYEISPDVYGTTKPSQHTPRAHVQKDNDTQGEGD